MHRSVIGVFSIILVLTGSALCQNKTNETAVETLQRDATLNAATDAAYNPEAIIHFMNLMRFSITNSMWDSFLFLGNPAIDFMSRLCGNPNTNAVKKAFGDAVLNITPAMIVRSKEITDESTSKSAFLWLLTASYAFVDQSGRFSNVAFDAAFQNIDKAKVTSGAKFLNTTQGSAMQQLLVTSGNFLDKNGKFTPSLFNKRFDAVKPSDIVGDEETRRMKFIDVMKSGELML